MRRFTFIRHGTTDWNVRGLFQGTTDIPLDELGRSQAAQLQPVLAPLVEPDALIVSSPLSRALETAQIALPNREISVDDRLMEIHFGEFEGADLAGNSAHPFFLEWTADPFDTAAPGGESFRQLRDRTRDWFLEAATLDAKHVVVFSHSGAIQMILAELLGIERPSYQRRLTLANTGVTRVSYTAHGDSVEAVIECVNDTRHLRPEDVR